MLDILLFILFIISLILQIGYLLTIQLGLRRVTTAKNPKPEPISVIICAKNQLGNLKILIPYLLNQSHPNFEIVIVNDRSTDGTRKFLDDQRKSTSKLTLVHVEETPGHIDPKKYAITLGVKAAAHEKLIFTDADCYPNSNHWLIHLSSGLTDDRSIVLGYSGYEKEDGFLNYFIRFETIWTGSQYISLAALGHPYMGVGRNMGYKKSLFLNSKGFNGYQKLTGGDDDLFVQKNANPINTSIVIGPESLVWSKPKQTWREYYIQKLRHLSIGKQYSLKSKAILSVWSSSHFLFWLLLISLAIFRIEPYLSSGFFFLRTYIFYFTFKRSSQK